jgi:hypothetical protein
LRKLILFFDLFREIDRDVAKTSQLAAQTAPIDEVARTNERKLFRSGG